MNNVEILYSLFGVDERFDSILQDPIFTNHLNFLKWSSKKFLNIFSPDIIFDRFCLQILPAVREKIQWLRIDSSSMNQILHATHYPNLHGLGLFNIEEETIKSLFTDVNLSSGLFNNQISKLLVTIGNGRNLKDYSTMEYIINHIFTVFKKLTRLTFAEASYQNAIDVSNVQLGKKTKTYKVSPTDTISELKRWIRENEKIPLKFMKLAIWNNKSVNDCETLFESKINKEMTITVSYRFRGGYFCMSCIFPAVLCLSGHVSLQCSEAFSLDHNKLLHSIKTKLISVNHVEDTKPNN
ncbi:unnamed protein product [Rotaria socialis]|nr:unnamed protein product [Rotaria socialis]